MADAATAVTTLDEGALIGVFFKILDRAVSESGDRQVLATYLVKEFEAQYAPWAVYQPKYGGFFRFLKDHPDSFSFDRKTGRVALAAEFAKKARPTKVPVTMLTGFLGSGKTTLLNHILESPDHGMRFAIIENEFGDVGVDEKILSQKTNEELIEVMNGCICCTVRGDLVEALIKLHSKIEQFDGVIIETTGLADPAPVAQTFFVDEKIARLYTLDGIITVVDAMHIIPRLDDEKPEGAENEAVEQVAFADRILLNKTDLVSDEAELKAIETRLKTINPSATITRCEQSRVDPMSLIKIGAFDLDKVMMMDPEFLNEEAEHEHDATVTSCAAKFDGELAIAKLQDLIGKVMKELGANLFRYKGILAVKGMKEKYVFQGVGMLFAGQFSKNGLVWNEGETRECRFVFIGRHLDHDMLKSGFMACKYDEKPLRFKIGDKVEARVSGGFKGGKIIVQWDEGPEGAMPYRIELDDGEGTNVWGPVDEDEYVRALRVD